MELIKYFVGGGFGIRVFNSDVVQHSIIDAEPPISIFLPYEFHRRRVRISVELHYSISETLFHQVRYFRFLRMGTAVRADFNRTRTRVNCYLMICVAMGEAPLGSVNESANRSNITWTCRVHLGLV